MIFKKTAIILMVIALLMPLFGVHALSAEEGELGALTWSFSDGVLTISGYGSMPDLASYTDQPWRSLATSVKKITVSPGVTGIGDFAFAMMPRLTSVSLPRGITRIGRSAFEKCYALKIASLPVTVSTVEDLAFSDCRLLTTVNIALASSVLEHIGDFAFAGCYALSQITLPLRLTYIGESAFAGCSSLDGIKLPDNLSHLGRFAFQDCTSLTSVNIPWQIKILPDYCFFGCSSLTSVSFGRYLEKIGKEAFLWCPSLKEIRFPAGVSEIPDYSVGYYYFNRQFVSYGPMTVIAASPEGMEYALKNGFRLITDDSSHLCSEACPYCSLCTVECDYYSCYDKCFGHTFPITGNVSESITWSLSEDFELTLDGSGAMPDFTYDTVPWSAYKNAVHRVTVADGITSVGSYTFDSHSSLSEISVPKSVRHIGRKAFALCTSLVGFSAPGAVTVGELAFNGCTSLEYAHLGEDISSIGRYSFCGCVSLLELKTGDALESIGESAFENCHMLESFTVPEGVSYIGDFALGYTYGADRHYYKNDSFTVIAPLFSEGHRYAEKNGIAYERNDTHPCETFCEVCSKCLDAECIYPECEKKCDGICTAPWESPFTDVREGSWYYDSVRYVYLKGLFTGMTESTFVPSGTVTRAQLTVVLWRLADSPAAKAEAPFSDLTASWYRDAVSWAYASGVVNGVSETRFAPSGSITREQMVTMLMRFYDRVLCMDTSARSDTEIFYDSSEISSYAVDAVSWAAAEGLVTGKSSDKGMLIAPRVGASRAECSTIFARLLKK